MLKTSKLKTVVLAIDIIIFVVVVSLHIASHCMKIGQPYYGKVLVTYYYFFYLGMPWAFCGIVKRFIMHFNIFEKRFIAAFLIGFTVFSVWYAVDCAVIFRHIDATFTELFYGTFFKSLSPFRHAAYFFIIYLLRLELPIFIRNVKTVGLVNTIFGEED